MAGFAFVARCALAAIVFAVGCHGAVIDPDHKMNLTMYHINPLSAGVIPADEDTGDLDGILYFYLGTLVLPLECAGNETWFRDFDCANPERTSADMVHTRVEMEVDDRFTGYSLCNLCTTGIDPISQQPCVIGEYQCNCGSQDPTACDKTRVGWEDMRDQFMPYDTPASCKSALVDVCGAMVHDGDQCHACVGDNQSHLTLAGCTQTDWETYCPTMQTCQMALDSVCGWAKNNLTTCGWCEYHGWQNLSAAGCTGVDAHSYCPNDDCTGKIGEEWKCYRTNLANKTGGKWYSPTKEGFCQDKDEGNCSWRITSMLTVNDTCVKDSIAQSVEAAAPDCFGTCGERNYSSPCWGACFFDALLGPEGRSSPHADVGNGIRLEDVERGYLNAFREESKGGCPPIHVDQNANVLIV